MKFLVAIALFLITGSMGLAASNSKSMIIDLQVTEKGFEPSAIDIKPGTSVVLRVTRKTDATCVTSIQIASKKIKKDLPLNQSVSIDLGKLDKGEIRFACGMNMITGNILVR